MTPTPPPPQCSPALSERRPEENPPYEYGGRTRHKTWGQFRVRYAVLALLFVAFEMEMVYMFPWAVVFKRLGLVAFLDMFVFLAILTAAIVFASPVGYGFRSSRPGRRLAR